MQYSRTGPVSLVLGGGGGRGLAHIGAWRALQERGIAVDRVVGSSAGALIGASIASGLSWRELTEKAKRLARGSVFSLDPRILYRGARNPGLLRGDPVRALIRELIPVARFDELRLPLSVNALDLVTGEVVWFGEDGRTDVSLADAVYASCALPFLFPPAAVAGSLLVDAGIVDPLPISRARALGATRIVAVDLAARAEIAPEGAGLFDTYRRVFEILRPQAEVPGATGEDLVRIRPGMSGRGTFDLSQAEGMMESGYRAARQVLAAQEPETPQLAWTSPEPRELSASLRDLSALLGGGASVNAPRPISQPLARSL